MRRAAPFVCLLAVTWWHAGCGYIGDPLPPALNIPAAIQDLTAVQRGDKLHIRFSPSLESTEGLILPRLSAIELRVGPVLEPAFQIDAWGATARPIAVDPAAEAPVDVVAPITGFEGREVVIAARALGPTRRPGQWSSLAVVQIIAPLDVPTALRADPRPGSIRLTWEGGRAVERAVWRVFKASGPEAQGQLAGRTSQPVWEDPAVAFDQTYVYTVQKALPAGRGEGESLMSAPLTVRYTDAFAPAAPRNVVAIPGVNTIELSWDPGAEADLRGYLLFRATPDGAFDKLGDVLSAPQASDRSVESGKRYRYRVAAVDQAGNQSPPSDIIEITAP